MKMREEILVIW